MDGWMESKREYEVETIYSFMGGLKLHRREVGNKAIAHSCGSVGFCVLCACVSDSLCVHKLFVCQSFGFGEGAASILLVTISHWMTYVHLVFHQQDDSRYRAETNTRVCFHKSSRASTGAVTGVICSSFLM